MIDGFIEDDRALLAFYSGEAGMPYPFPWSEPRIAYARIPGLHAFQTCELKLRRLAEDWRPSPAIIAHTAAAHARWLAKRASSVLFDGDNVRGAGILVEEAPPVILVQRNRYQDYSRTNLVIDARAVPGAASLRELLHPSGRLEPVGASELGNNLGVSLLVINQAGEIPLQIRSSRLAVRPGQLCASASGTMQMSDIPGWESRLLDCDLLREAREELGEELVATLSPPVLLGVARELARGGQAELFLLAEGRFDRALVGRSNAAAADGRGTETAGMAFLQLPCTGGVYEVSTLEQVVSEMELTCTGGVAGPLRAHLALLFRYFAERGALRTAE